MIPTLFGITHRVIAVDEQLGVVAMRMNFGPGSLFEGKGELDIWHSFKIYDGQIQAAEAHCRQVPPLGTNRAGNRRFEDNLEDHFRCRMVNK